MANHVDNSIINFGLIEREGREQYGSISKLLRKADISSPVYYAWKNNKSDPQFGSIKKLTRIIGKDLRDAIQAGNHYPSAA